MYARKYNLFKFVTLLIVLLLMIWLPLGNYRFEQLYPQTNDPNFDLERSVARQQIAKEQLYYSLALGLLGVAWLYLLMED